MKFLFNCLLTLTNVAVLAFALFASWNWAVAGQFPSAGTLGYKACIGLVLTLSVAAQVMTSPMLKEEDFNLTYDDLSFAELWVSASLKPWLGSIITVIIAAITQYAL